MDKSDVAGVLEEAARLYKDEKVEWCQGSWYGRDERGITMCAEGALMRASGFRLAEVDMLSGGWVEQYKPRAERTKRALALFNASREELVACNNHPSHPGHEDVPCESVICFNDAPRRTKEEVIDWFEATAKDLRNG